MIRRDVWRLLLRIACGIGGALVLLYVANSLTQTSSGIDGPKLPYLPIAIIFAPAAVYLAFRWPLIFPFGLYFALVPFDAVLSVTTGATWVRLIAGLAGLAMIARMLLLRRFIKPAAGWYAWGAFVAWAGLSLMWTPDLPESQRVYGIVIQNFLMMTVLAFYPIKEIEFKWLGFMIIASGFLAAAYALHNGDTLGGRLTIGTGELKVDPNAFATSFVLPIALTLALALSTRETRTKILCFGAAAFMMLPILMTASRGGVVAIILLFVYFALRSPHRIQILTIAGICLALSAFFPHVWDRFVNDEGARGSGSGRTYIWAVGIHAIKANWLFGTGFGSFLETYDRNFFAVYQAQNQGMHRPSHDIIIGTWVETGLVGLMLVLGAWYTSFRQMKVILKTSPLYPVRIAFEASIIALFAQSLFIDPIWIKYIWLAQSLPLLLMNSLVTIEQRRTVPVRPRIAAPAA
jgi:hypothetical protein